MHASNSLLIEETTEEILPHNFCNNIDELINNKEIINNINKDKDFFIQCEDSKMQFTSTHIQKKEHDKNKTIIILGKCEEQLKNYYNISNSSALYILKKDYDIKGILIPIIEYEVFFPLNNSIMKQLNLSLCKNTTIELSIPVDIKDDIDLHNPNSEYYNNICTKTTSDSGTDIIIDDRRNEFVEKNRTLCEDNCKFEKYDENNKKVNCSCEVKTFMSLINEIKIDKNKLLKNFKDINYITNIQIVKCYKIAFIKNNLKKNYGFYIFIIDIFFFLICTMLFCFKYYSKLIEEINAIISALKNKFSEKETMESNKEKSYRKPKKNKKGKKRRYLTENNKSVQSKEEPPKLRKIEKNILENSDNELIKEIKINYKNNSKKNEDINSTILELNDYELNSLLYNEALNYDNRNFFQVYLSLIKMNHLILFAFYPNKDYNSPIIKIFLLFFSFGLNLAINALFFTDGTMHKIYIDEGAFNLNYQIPQIIYSTLISGILNAVIKFLSLSEKNIISLKQLKEIKNIDEKLKETIKVLKIKFILFFAFVFVLLMIFWFYISCFCAIYENTQIQLIEDTIISFCLSFVYPFVIYLIPTIIRLSSLKSKMCKKECLYKLSQLF